MIPQFSLVGGWTMVPDPVPDDSSDLNKDIEAAGFHRHHNLRLSMYDEVLEVWARPPVDGEYLLCLTLGDKCQFMLATDFSSLIELIAKLKPTIDLQYRSHLAELVSDIHELLTEYEGCGPLGEAVYQRAREREEQETRQRIANAKREAKKETP